ncbi:MAG: DHHW family protein [Clostridiales bacterium]|nr:DHHW family protein [Clostridiales bacterium]
MTDKMKKDSAIPNPPDIDKSEHVVEQNKRHGMYSNTIIFLVLIFGLTIASIVSKDKGFSENENRVLASKPTFTWDTLLDGTYISKYETYITDQFVSRDRWIGLKTRVELALMKKDINGVYFGKDNYLIEKVDVADVDKEQVDKNTQRLDKFIKKYTSQLGKDHVYAMIVPTAFEILSEKLPPFATGFDQAAYLDRLKSVLGSNFIDLRNELNEHDKEYIFYRTDHHWTTLGAYYAYIEWAKTMGITPMTKEEFDIKIVSTDFLGTIYSKVNVKVPADTMEIYDSGFNYQVEYNMDKKIKDTLYELSYLDTKDKYSMYVNGNNSFVEINSENKNGKKLLIIKDSYAHCFTPFAANHFETTYLVDLRYLNMPMSTVIDQYGITDVLVLYNVNSFIKDKNLLNLVR